MASSNTFSGVLHRLDFGPGAWCLIDDTNTKRQLNFKSGADISSLSEGARFTITGEEQQLFGFAMACRTGITVQSFQPE